jgi:hypothetical protein
VQARYSRAAAQYHPPAHYYRHSTRAGAGCQATA